MSADVIRKAFSATEEDFISLVRKQWLIKPQVASVGSCCLVGVISSGMLFVANVGDSRVVLGRFEEGIGEVTAVQMCTEHNASFESVRNELRSLHPDDPNIVVLKNKVWRVKGLIQVIHLPKLFCPLLSGNRFHAYSLLLNTFISYNVGTSTCTLNNFCVLHHDQFLCLLCFCIK